MGQDLITTNDPDSRLKNIEALLSSALKLRDRTSIEAQAEERLERIERLLTLLAMTTNAIQDLNSKAWGLQQHADVIIGRASKTLGTLECLIREFKKGTQALKLAHVALTVAAANHQRPGRKQPKPKKKLR